MAITQVRNSPIGWREQQESEWTQCENTYSQAWINEETMRFQVVVPKLGANILTDDPLTPYLSGTTTADGSSSLTDSGASFLSDPISTDHLVVNVDEETQTLVNTVVSDAVVSLDDDIFGTGTSGDAYEFLAITGLTGNVSYDAGDNVLIWTPDTITERIVLEDVFPTTSDRYVVEVDIEDYTGGSLFVRTGTYGGAFEESDSPRAKASGTFSFYMVPLGNDLELRDASNEANYKVTGIRIYETSIVKWYLTDSDFDTEFDSGIPLSSAYKHDRCQVVITPDVVDGEYAIQIEDRVLTTEGGYIANYQFSASSSFGWTLTNTGTGWDISANQLNHTAGGGVGTNYAEVELRATTNADCAYRITADITSDSPTVEGKDADGNYTTLGTLATTLTFTGGAYTHIRLSLTEVDTGTVDNIKVEPVLTCPDLESYPICIAETLDESFLEFRGIVDFSRGGGFLLDRRAFIGNYTERMWIGANIRFGRYEDPEGEQYRDANGRSTLVYSDRIKVYECQVAPVPSWVHDWITWALRGVFEVDRVEMYPYDLNYGPNWDKRTGNAPVIFDLAEQDVLLQKTLCG
jgi:hypothetical protein